MRHSKKELDSYIEDVRHSQRNTAFLTLCAAAVPSMSFFLRVFPTRLSFNASG
jgi:hypothetical protein